MSTYFKNIKPVELYFSTMDSILLSASKVTTSGVFKASRASVDEMSSDKGYKNITLTGVFNNTPALLKLRYIDTISLSAILESVSGIRTVEAFYREVLSVYGIDHARLTVEFDKEAAGVFKAIIPFKNKEELCFFTTVGDYFGVFDYPLEFEDVFKSKSFQLEELEVQSGVMADNHTRLVISLRAAKNTLREGVKKRVQISIPMYLSEHTKNLVKQKEELIVIGNEVHATIADSTTGNQNIINLKKFLQGYGTVMTTLLEIQADLKE